ncbi:MAG: DUF1553 domain-containing protein [Cytophagaceae bacterium]|nr:DUF1553 domain-containing protein [Cytophagaceae bacterium]
MSQNRWQIAFFFAAVALFGAALFGSCSRSVSLPDDVQAAMQRLPDKVDYTYQVKPLLSDRCFACHGPDKNKQQAGLRLDIKESAYDHESEESGRNAIVPGNPASSELVHRILATDPKVMMPTPESHLSLTAEEKAILIKWVEQGAEYKPHWSFVAPQKAPLPEVKNKTWVRNDIDRFVLKTLEDKGLQPAPEADKTTILRRVSLDLTGLPPTPAEVDAFLADTRPNAYENVVDRLLASPHYGERMAVEWLDIARYADTHGYQDDGLRTIWPYRDWVISAFNKNLPYDKFITWQLAGDMLPSAARPDAAREILTATAFNRNHQQSQEGGIIDEEYRIEYVADRANTFGKAFLGLTTECARCHDHKYDPISQKDYYSLFAFFNNNNERGEIPYNGEAAPTMTLTTPDVDAKLKAIREKLTPLAQQLNPDQAVYQPGFSRWLSSTSNVRSAEAGQIGQYSFDEKDRVNLVAYAKEKDAERSLKEVEEKKKKAAEARANVGKKAVKSPEAPKKEEKKPFRKKTRDELLKDPRNAFENSVNDTIPAHLGGDVEKLPYRVKGRFGAARFLPGDSYLELPRNVANFDRHEPFTLSAWLNVRRADVTGFLLGRADGPFNGQRGYEWRLTPDGRLKVTLSHVWPDNAIDLESTVKMPVKTWYNMAMTYDGSGRAEGVRLFLNGTPLPVQVLTNNLKHSMTKGKDGTSWGGVQPFLIGRTSDQYTKGYAIDELRIYNRALTELEIPTLAGQPDRLQLALRTPANQRTAEQVAGLRRFYVTVHDPLYQNALREATALRLEETMLYNNSDQLMVMSERKFSRKSFILKRGAYDVPGDEVSPATPAQLMAFPKDYPKNRLGLAKWLLHPDNSLFSRVAVNRFWQTYFGRGLVGSVDDFGNQGELPSHPQLLDYLAVTFRESVGPASASRSPGWNVKSLQKMIVLSATYRQSSNASEKLRELDPDNRLLARGPSYRISAEQIRDNALKASGLLAEKIGGPSVLPYQPAGIWEALATRNAVSYVQDQGDSLYRRSMYTFWKRSSPPPMMLNFDASERHFCIVKRQKTSTPLQALVTLNDPQFVEAARVLAERMLKEGGSSPDARIVFAYKALTSRPPRPQELALLKQLYADELADFRRQPKRVEALLNVGEFPRDKTLRADELATSTVVASTIMNFDEFVIKR